MPRDNKTRYALLGVLAAGPASGYDIKKFCDKSIAHFWNENYGHIYPVLKELEGEELIVGETMNREGRPPRTVCHITEKGREELKRWLMQPVELAPVRHELLLKLIFAGNAPPDSIIGKIHESRRLHSEHLEGYKSLEQVYASHRELVTNPDYPYWISALRYGIMDAEFRIRWCDETLERLEKAIR